MRVLWHEEDGNETAADGDDTFDDEEPSPASNAVDTIECETSSCNEAAKGAAEHLKHEEGGKALSKFVFGIPGAEEVDDTGEEDGFGNTEEDTDDEKTCIALDGSC